MLLSLSFSVAMESKIIFLIIHYCKDINILTDMMREHCLESNLQQLFHKNIAGLAIAREFDFA